MRDALENLGYVALAMLGYLLALLFPAVLLGKLELVWAILKGFILLWAILFFEQAVQALVQKTLRLSELENPTVVVFNLLMTLTLCVFWAAFLALEVSSAVQGIGWLGAGLLYLLGVLGAWIGFGVVTSFFTGTLYRISGLVLVLVAYLLFLVFPAFAAGGFGWFFMLFK